MTEKEKDILNRFGKFLYTKVPSNEFLVEIVKLTGGQLNLQTISDYSKTHSISYQGTKTCRKIEPLFGVKFVIDGD